MKMIADPPTRSARCESSFDILVRNSLRGFDPASFTKLVEPFLTDMDTLVDLAVCISFQDNILDFLIRRSDWSWTWWD
jgi:hypothetical protein